MRHIIWDWNGTRFDRLPWVALPRAELAPDALESVVDSLPDALDA